MNIRESLLDASYYGPDCCLLMGVNIYFNYRFALSHAEWIEQQRVINNYRKKVSFFFFSNFFNNNYIYSNFFILV